MPEFTQVALAQPGLSYTNRNVTINSGMAAGTTAILAANPDRRSLLIKAPKDCSLALHASATAGVIDLYGGVADRLTGPDCPQNAVYVFGLSVNDVLLIEEG